MNFGEANNEMKAKFVELETAQRATTADYQTNNNAKSRQASSRVLRIIVTATTDRWNRATLR